MKVINDRKKINEYIKKHNFDEYLTDTEMYMPGFKLINFSKGEYLYTHPEERKYIYFLVEGRFSIYATDEKGNQMLVRYCDKFICLGDMELIGHSEPSNAIEMDSNCTFLAIDVSLYKEQLMSDVVFLRRLATGLSEKLNYFARMQFHTTSITPRQRVISHIITEAGETLYYKENLRKTAIVLSISYRHLHRILSELVAEDILIRKNNGYEIKSISKLEKMYYIYEKQ